MSLESNSDKQRVDIAIPVYNARDHFFRCLDSVLKHTDSSHSVGIFDDSSTDQQIQTVVNQYKKKHPKLNYFRSDVQQGFVENVNTAIKHFKNDLVILNSDCIVGPEWLERLIAGYKKLAKPGIVCPLSNNATLLTVTSQADDVTLDRLVEINADIQPEEPISIPVAVGFCMLVSRKMIETIGDLDPVFSPGYGEEVDWSLRARKAGFEIAAIPDVLVLHSGSASFSNQKNIAKVKQENGHLIKVKWPQYARMVKSWWKVNPLRSRIEQLDAKSRNSERKLIAHLIHRIDSAGGTETIARQLINGLNDRFDHLVILPSQPNTAQWSDAEEQRLASNIRFLSWNRRYSASRHYVQGSPADVKDLWVESWLTTVLEEQKPALIHIHHLYGWGTFRPLEIAGRLGIPVLYSLHDFHLMCPDYNQIGQDLEPCGKSIVEISDSCAECLKPRMFIQSSDKEGIKSYIAARRQTIRSQLHAVSAFISPSEYLKKRFGRAFGPQIENKTAVIPHAVYLSDTVKRNRFKKEKLHCAMLGGFKFLKGIEVLIKAASQLDHRVQFHIYGMPGDSFELAQELPENCKYLGGYAAEDVSNILNGNDLVIIPSLFEETFSLVLSEAWANGLPVVASRRGALADRVIPGKNGWLFEPGDADELAGILRSLLDDESQSRVDGVKKNLQSEIVSIDAWLCQYADLYKQTFQRNNLKSLGTNSTTENIWKSFSWNAKKYFQSNQAEESSSSRHEIVTSPAFPVTAIVWRKTQADDQAINRAFSKAVQCKEINYWLLPKGTICQEWRFYKNIKFIEYSNTNLVNYIDQFKIQLLLGMGLGDVLYSESWSKFIRTHRQVTNYDAVIFDHDHCDRHGYRYSQLARGAWDHLLADSSTDLDSFIALRADLFKRVDLKPNAPIGKLLSSLIDFDAPIEIINSSILLGSRLDINQKIESRKAIGVVDVNSKLKLLDVETQILVFHESSASLLEQTLKSILPLDRANVVIFHRCAVSYQSRWPGSWKWASNWNQMESHLNDTDCVLVVRSGIKINTSALVGQAFKLIESNQIVAIGLNVQALNGEIKSSILIRGSNAGSMSANRPWPGGHAADLPRFQIASKLSGNAVIYRSKTLKMWLCARNIKKFQDYRNSIYHLPGLLVDCSISIGQMNFSDSYHHYDDISNDLEPEYQYSRKLSLTSPYWEIEKQAAAVLEDTSNLPVVIAITPDQWASSQYRLRLPLKFLKENGKISSPAIYSLNRDCVPRIQQILRLNPKIIILHNVFHFQAIELVRSIKNHHEKPLIIFLQDDLITDLPEYHPSYGMQEDDLADRLKSIWELSDRVIFSTKRLGSNYNLNNSLTIENALDKEKWINCDTSYIGLSGRRLRVGWAGAHQHEGDLRLIRSVVESTYRFVDWIFFGLCPAYLLPFVKKHIDMVDFDLYPDTLRSLKLDLGVIPLENNEFNQCKSRLKVLEFGALGIPVIASDRTPYQGCPVHLAPDDSESWVNKISFYNENRSSLRADGLLLRNWVMRNHFIDNKIQDWQKALGLPEF